MMVSVKGMGAVATIVTVGTVLMGCSSSSGPSATRSSSSPALPSATTVRPTALNTIPVPDRPAISSDVADGEVLPDGTYFGFLRGADAQARTVVFDLMQHFIGAAANSAESEDGADQLDGYTRNPSEAVRTLPVSADVVVTRVGCCVYEGAVGTFDGLAASFPPHGSPTPGDYSQDYRGALAPYWISIKAGVVTRIDEQYES